MGRSRTGPVLVGTVVLAAALAACAIGPGGPIRAAQQDLEGGRIDQAVERLEAARVGNAGSADFQDMLGVAYYRRARKAFDEGRHEDYGADLERAVAAWVASLRIDPTSPRPHTWMGIAAAYQGNIGGATQSFRNALRLAPRSWVSYTNLAQTLIYQGQIGFALRWLRKARPLGPNPAVVDLNLSLAAWRRGDLVEARDTFESAYRFDPEVVNNWDEAPVPEPIETFEDFTSYCCSNPACGPYMEEACGRMRLDVKRRDVRDETILRELRIEMERRRQLEEIYRERKDLKIEVDPAPPVPEP